MPLVHSFHSTRSCAILAPRLLQAACIILYSLLRLISSDNDTASIVTAFVVSIDHRIIITMTLHAVTLASCDTILSAAQPRRWQAGPKESLFLWRGEATGPLPHTPRRASSKRGNPSPHKNSIFLCPYFSLDRCSGLPVLEFPWFIVNDNESSSFMWLLEWYASLTR